ncbi:MAG: hypothetical protein H6891_08675 [Brucellaceae bacterium]|nr:hypothetical protein [Brucellaceae bacterium]
MTGGHHLTGEIAHDWVVVAGPSATEALPQRRRPADQFQTFGVNEMVDGRKDAEPAAEMEGRSANTRAPAESTSRLPQSASSAAN